MIDEILKEVPDKTKWFATTSHKFKKDVWDFCSDPMFKDMIAVELGTSNGHSTFLLSHIFNHVYTVNNNDSIFAKKFNKNRSNITFYNFDLYNTDWKLKTGDVFFVDADHSYSSVCSDIENCLKLKSNMLKKKIFIFDDYGVKQYQQSVRLAVDKYINNGTLEILGYVGHEVNYSFDNSEERRLEHFEGIICQEK